MKKFVVNEVYEDYIVCISDSNKLVSIDTEGLIILFEVGDEIFHIEHGFCDIYRNNKTIGGLTNLYTRMFVK